MVAVISVIEDAVYEPLFTDESAERRCSLDGYKVAYEEKSMLMVSTL